jgi:hypothetical protein
MPRPKPAKQASGSARQKAKGRHPILLWVTKAELATLRKLAAAERRPVTQYVLSKVLPANDL